MNKAIRRWYRTYKKSRLRLALTSEKSTRWEEASNNYLLSFIPRFNTQDHLHRWTTSSRVKQTSWTKTTRSLEWIFVFWGNEDYVFTSEYRYLLTRSKPFLGVKDRRLVLSLYPSSTSSIIVDVLFWVEQLSLSRTFPHWFVYGYRFAYVLITLIQNFIHVP